jgi:hypothetical protein
LAGAKATKRRRRPKAGGPKTATTGVGRLPATEARLAHQERTLKKLQADVERLTANVDALVRGLLVRPLVGDEDAPLEAHAFGLLSQNGEDGITLALLNATGSGGRRFAEIGCGRNGGNSGFLASELGWSGLMVDADPVCTMVARQRFHPERVSVVGTWVTRENVDELLREHGCAGELDFLSVDIDGNDYWIWEALTASTPRIVVIEYNALLGPERSVVVPYDPDFDRHRLEPTYCGASLPALARLGVRKGYRLVAVDPSGVNAFFLREDVAPEIPAREPGDVYRMRVEVPPIGPKQRRRGLVDPRERLWEHVERNELPLVEVG